MEEERKGLLLFNSKNKIRKKMKEHIAYLYDNSVSGRSRLELYESKKDYESGSHVLLLVGTNIIKVQRLVGDNTDGDNRYFLVSTIDQQQYTFGAQNEVDCKEWVKTMQKLLFGISPPTARHSQGQGQGQGQAKATNDFTIDNDVYVSAEEFMPRDFTMTMTPATRHKLAADNPVRLVVENNNITVIRDGVLVMRWAIEHLRRLGYTDNNFHLEAGRKSKSGEGEFIFNTSQGKQFYNLVNREKANLKKSGGSHGVVPAGQVSLPPTPHLAMGELPPLIIPSIGNHVYEELPHPLATPKNKLKSGSSFDNDQAKSTSKTAPIKSLPTSAKPTNATSSTTLVLDPIYHEAVVPGPNAWKTHGIDVDDEDTQPVAMNTDVPCGESIYSNLKFHTPVNNNQASGESPYQVLEKKPMPTFGGTNRNIQNSPIPQQQQQQQQQQAPVPVECIYAQVNFNKKKNKKGSSGNL